MCRIIPWNYLATGYYGTDRPITGGEFPVEYEFIHPSECADILHQGFLPLSVANSMNYLTKCLNEPNGWVAQNYKLFNINDPQCRLGHDQQCSLDGNQYPQCPSSLGENAIPETDITVVDIEYGTGNAIST